MGITNHRFPHGESSQILHAQLLTKRYLFCWEFERYSRQSQAHREVGAESNGSLNTLVDIDSSASTALIKIAEPSSVTSSRSRNEQFGCFLGFEGIANFFSATSASLCEITVTKIRLKSETHHPCAEKPQEGQSSCR